MPNWVRNIVKVPKRIMPDIKKMYFENDRLTFDKVIPMPKDLMITSGSITRTAMLYALSLKKPDEIMKMSKLLLNHGYRLTMEEFQIFFDDDMKARLEKDARKYVPSETEKRLGLNTLEKFGNHCLKNLENYGHIDWYDWCWKNWGVKWDIDESFSCNKDTMVFDTAWATPIPIFETLSKEFPEDLIEVQYADEDIYGNNIGILKFKNGDMIYDVNRNVRFANRVWNYVLDENVEEAETEFEQE